MSLRKDSEIDSVPCSEGTKIKQYFHPHNTLNGISYSLAQFVLGPGKKSKIHKMSSSEIYYIIEGSGNLRIGGETYCLKKNDSVYVPPNAKQSMENQGNTNLKFLCIVEPAWKAEDETILE